MFTHLSSLLAERSSDYAASMNALASVCGDMEVEYEKSESTDALACFAQAKADLARSQLAAGDYEEAIANSQTSLDLSSEMILVQPSPKAVQNGGCQRT